MATMSWKAATRKADAYSNRGLAYGMKGDCERAIGDFSKAIQLDPQEYNTYCNRGTAYVERKQLDEAIRDYSRAIRLNPKRADAYSIRGRTYWQNREYDKAVQDYTEAIRLDPAESRSRNCCAWLLSTCPRDKIRNGKRARRLATQACERTGYANLWYLATLAAAHAQCGDFKEAVRWQKKAMEMGLDCEDSRDTLKLYEQGKPYRDPNAQGPRFRLPLS